MSDVVFNIIMPCYNSQSFLYYSVKSVLNQTYKNWKLICINDGSTDKTLEILNYFANNDSRISVFSKQNGGYATAVNFGLDKLYGGEYFMFLGSDDMLTPHLLESIVKNLTSPLPDCIAFKTLKHINSTTQEDSYTNFKKSICEYNTTLKNFSSSYNKESQIFFVRDTSKMFKTSLLQDLRYFGTTGMDSDGIFSMLFCHKASSFLILPIDGYYWSIREDSVSATINTKKLLDMINNWDIFFTVLHNVNPNEITLQELNYSKRVLTHIQDLILNSKQKLDNAGIKTIHHLSKTINKLYKKLNQPNPSKFHFCILSKSITLYKLFIKIKSLIKK